MQPFGLLSLLLGLEPPRRDSLLVAGHTRAFEQLGDSQGHPSLTWFNCPVSPFRENEAVPLYWTVARVVREFSEFGWFETFQVPPETQLDRFNYRQ